MSICIDPGHSGSDPGAVANGLQEKDLTLAISKKVLARLDSSAFPTHTDDSFVDLDVRAVIANNAKAQYFCSIHINAGGGTGFESYVFDGPHSPETDRIRDIIHSHVAKVFAAHGLPDRGKKSANFAVLRETAMPACLLELGFIDSTLDSSYLRTDSFQNELADAIATGLNEALGQTPAPAPQAVPAPPPVVHVPYPGSLILIGSRGNAVKMIQRVVGVRDDGIFGPVTDGAVRRWQDAHGLIPDGQVGPLTWAKMF